MDREAIYSALFNLVKGTPGIKASSRRFIPWTEVSPADQPFFIQLQKGEVVERQPRMPSVWRLHVSLVFYAHNSGQASVAPSTILNPIIDAVISKLQPPAHLEEQTLGGLVQRCFLDGEVLTDEGVLGDQAVVVIPTTILVPS